MHGETVTLVALLSSCKWQCALSTKLHTS